MPTRRDCRERFPENRRSPGKNTSRLITVVGGRLEIGRRIKARLDLRSCRGARGTESNGRGDQYAHDKQEHLSTGPEPVRCLAELTNSRPRVGRKNTLLIGDQQRQRDEKRTGTECEDAVSSTLHQYQGGHERGILLRPSARNDVPWFRMFEVRRAAKDGERGLHSTEATRRVRL